jgi:hypothetical protein
LDQLLAQFPITTEWDRESRARLEGICRLMDAAKPDRLRLAKLRATLDTIDQRRNTDWRSLFPDIDQYFNKNGI